MTVDGCNVLKAKDAAKAGDVYLSMAKSIFKSKEFMGLRRQYFRTKRLEYSLKQFISETLMSGAYEKQ